MKTLGYITHVAIHTEKCYYAQFDDGQTRKTYRISPDVAGILISKIDCREQWEGAIENGKIVKIWRSGSRR